MVKSIDLDQLNPGIRRTVRLLRDLGFETMDSGDGKTHEFECDRDYPYVVIESSPEDLISDTLRLYVEMAQRGVIIKALSMENTPAIQASYDPGNNLAVIDLMNVDDELLFGKD